MSRTSMAFSESRSTAPFKPSKLRNSQSLVNIRSSSASSSSPEQCRTYGRRAPQDEPRMSGPDRTPDLRPATTMSLYSTSSSASLARRLSAREQRLSILNRAREAKEDDSGSESESWTTRAERRQSLARRLASPTSRIATDPPRAEMPRRSVSAAQARSALPKPAHLEQPPPYFVTGVSDEVLKEQRATDPETATRIVQIWEAMAKCFDEISRSTHGQTAQHETQPAEKGPSKLGTSEMETSGLNMFPLQESGVGYACPFRKRNPATFNIRDHECCAISPFTSMLDLRKHIVKYHKHKHAPRQCRRCKVKFESDTALSHHMMLPKDEMCELHSSKTEDLEDGISDAIMRTLCETNPKAVWSWERIWHLLFPNDAEVPDSDFQPIIELSEVDQAFDERDEELKANVRRTLRLFLPDEVQDDYCGFLAGQLDLVFQTHRANVIRQCLDLTNAATNISQQADKPVNGQHQTAARRSTRRSRQSSLLQHSRPFSINTSNKHLKRLSMDLNAHTPVSTPPPLLDYDTASTSPTLIGEDDDHTAMSSRDSGLGISCDLCGTEACRGNCASNMTRDKERQEQERGDISEQERDEWILSPKESARRASADVRGRYLRRQPEREVLRVRVDDEMRARLEDPGAGSGSGSGSGSEDGRFSPQSFKQRVMRRESGF
ncbi:hypothetical protein QBC44DRAFT_382762 [Cladorrhinum sp. PSN332]|nr:hypothetical protein QBC44DRAFT_382762 [Cladorrhinum sp. PSN332]